MPAFYVLIWNDREKRLLVDSLDRNIARMGRLLYVPEGYDSFSTEEEAQMRAEIDEMSALRKRLNEE